MEETAYAEFALSIFACLVMHNQLANLVISCIFCKIGDITVHVAIDLNVLYYLISISFESAIEIMQIMNARYLSSCCIEKFGRDGL